MTSDKDTIARLKEEVRGLQQALAEERAKPAAPVRERVVTKEVKVPGPVRERVVTKEVKVPDTAARQENRELRRRIKELATYKEVLNGNH